ncbi:hypothetical protein F0562_034937 [Nyssa sinensis]|uniref:Uncharacterized protein n=1 Tax=Nyssa sinensis TaxID=561372 RepID=A0A5J5ABB8_9ASTE|nr:hypothetical protein F0562_034937 [Nyssa sinensis]
MKMKKTFYYNFIPTEAEEAACKANKTPFEITRVLVDIRDMHPPVTVFDSQNPWKIKKSLTQYEVVTGKLVLSFKDAFDHVFRYWTLCMANHVVLGHKMHVIVWDVSEETNPKRYRNDGTFLEMLPNDDYALTCPDLVQNRHLNAEDEIGLYWDPSA